MPIKRKIKIMKTVDVSFRRGLKLDIAGNKIICDDVPRVLTSVSTITNHKCLFFSIIFSVYLHRARYNIYNDRYFILYISNLRIHFAFTVRFVYYARVHLIGTGISLNERIFYPSRTRLFA